MADVQHKDLTGTDLHETKGASTAAADTVHKANGSGVTSWSKVKEVNIDLTDMKNVNIEKQLFTCLTPATNFDFYLPVERTKTLIGVDTIINGAVTGATLTIDVMKNAGVVTSAVYTVAGTAAGTKTTATVSSALVTTDTLRIRSTSAGVVTAGAVTLLLTFRV